MPDDDKRERLLIACKATIARVGVSRATIAAVAREAGITAGLVHYYFPSKQRLVLSLFERLVGEFDARLDSVDVSPAEVIRGFVRRALALGADADPDGVRVWGWLSAEALDDPAIQDCWRATVDRWVCRLADAFGQLGAEGARELGGAVVSGVLGAWQLGTVAPGVLPPGSAAAAQIRLVDTLLERHEANEEA